MWFSVDNLVLVSAQAACVALPAAGLPTWAERFRTRAWALVMPLSIAVVVAAIGLLPPTADVLTWVALLLVPPGCALALGGRHVARDRRLPGSRSRCWRSPGSAPDSRAERSRRSS